MSYRVKPVGLPYVAEIYYPGVFGNFADTVKERIQALKQEEGFLNAEKVRFFEYLLGDVDLARFNALQSRYLLPPFESGCLKYLDPISWFEHKFVFAHRLGLHEKPPMKILDLGAGAGHFLVIARFYGHDAVGTDLPPKRKDARDTTDGGRSTVEFYDELGMLFRTNRLEHQIFPNTELKGLPKDVDLVTAFSVAFNLAGNAYWDIPKWEYFLADLQKNVLKKGGTLFMTLMKKKLDDEVWSYLKDHSSYSDDAQKYVLVDKFPASVAARSREARAGA